MSGPGDQLINKIKFTQVFNLDRIARHAQVIPPPVPAVIAGKSQSNPGNRAHNPLAGSPVFGQMDPGLAGKVIGGLFGQNTVLGIFVRIQ